MQYDDTVLDAKGDPVFAGSTEMVLEWIGLNYPIVGTVYQVRVGSDKKIVPVADYMFERLRSEPPKDSPKSRQVYTILMDTLQDVFGEHRLKVLDRHAEKMTAQIMELFERE